MATLHIVSKRQALADCLEVADTRDEIILLDDAVLGASADPPRKVWALKEDVATYLSQPVSELVQLTDYAGFVELVARCEPVVTWH